LAAANSLNSLNNFIGRAWPGRRSGGLVTATLGLAGAAALDGGTFAVAAPFCVRWLPAHIGPDSSADEPRHLVRELAEGLRAIAPEPGSRGRILIFVTITRDRRGHECSPLFAVYVTRALHVGGREMGLATVRPGGSAAILGSLSGWRITRRSRPVAVGPQTCFVLFGLGDLAIFKLSPVGT